MAAAGSARGTAAAVVALALAGCGGGAAPGPSAGSAVPSATAQDRTASACSAWVDSDAAAGPLLRLDPSATTPEQFGGAVRQFWTVEMPLLETVRQNGPPEIAAAADTLLEAARAGSATGDPATFADPGFAAADRDIDAAMVRSCGYRTVEVTAVDHAFSGVPSTLPPGIVAITVTNRGHDAHQAVLSRARDGVAQSYPEILGRPLAEQLQLTDPLTTTEAAAGESATMFVRLTPGRYGLVDLYPEGTTDPDVPGTGQPHAALGMVAEFTVA